MSHTPKVFCNNPSPLQSGHIGNLKECGHIGSSQAEIVLIALPASRRVMTQGCECEWHVTFQEESVRPQSQYSLMMKGQCLLDRQCEPSLSPAAPLLVGVPAEECVAHGRTCKTYHTTEWKPAGHLMNDGLYGVRCVCASCGYHQWFCATQCVQGSGWCEHGK